LSCRYFKYLPSTFNFEIEKNENPIIILIVCQLLAISFKYFLLFEIGPGNDLL